MRKRYLSCESTMQIGSFTFFIYFCCRLGKVAWNLYI